MFLEKGRRLRGLSEYVRGLKVSLENPKPPDQKYQTTMMNAATHFASRYAAPAAATGTLLALSLSPSIAVAKAESAMTADVASVKKSIAELIEDDMEKRGDGTSLTGTFVRLAWHCAGTYSKVDGSGGSNGARMRFNPEAR